MTISTEPANALRHIVGSYRVWSAQLGTSRDYNASLNKLKRSVASGRRTGRKRVRLHPWLELAINERWRREIGHAVDRTPTLAEMEAAILHAASTLQPIKGAPRHDVLKHHVACMMAWVFEATGKRIKAVQTRYGDYDPHLVGKLGQGLLRLFQHLDPQITETKLVNLVRALSRPGSPVEQGFRSLCPDIGGSCEPGTAPPVLGPGLRVERFGINSPLYCF